MQVLYCTMMSQKHLEMEFLKKITQWGQLMMLESGKNVRKMFLYKENEYKKHEMQVI